MISPLTVEDIKAEYGGDIVFLFKGAEPFTPHNEKPTVPLGVVLARSEDDKVLCFECNEWFDNLLNHVKSHSMTSKEYRSRYGISKSQPLSSKKTSRNISEATRERLRELMKERWAKWQKEGFAARRGKSAPNAMQYRNKFGTCPAQLKSRLELLAAKVGRTPSMRDARIWDRELEQSLKYHYGSWNKGKETLGFELLKPANGTPKKEEADLIYDLRKYIENNHRLPWYRNYANKAFPHSKKTYERHFGSSRRAWAVCGLQYLGGKTNKWIII